MLSDKGFADLTEKIEKSVNKQIKDTETGQREILKMIENLSSKIDSLTDKTSCDLNQGLNGVNSENVKLETRPIELNEFRQDVSQHKGTVLRNGKLIDSPSEVNAPEDLNMAQSNPNDSDTNDSSDISSQLSELKENYERKINELHLEFSQLKGLMMAVIDKTSNDSQPSSSQGPSKQPQVGRDSTFIK